MSGMSRAGPAPFGTRGAFQHLKKQCCRVIVEPQGAIVPD
jgi:hypothetical protein